MKEATLKRVSTFFTDGDWIESPFITDSGIRLIQTGNIGLGEFRDQGFRFISESSFRQLKCTEVLPGDVLISRLANTVGQGCIAPDLNCRMVASVDVVILRPSKLIDARFLVWYLSSGRHLGIARLEARGTTMQRLARSQVGDLPISLLPLAEQRAIADYLDAETARIDALIAKKQQLIHLLEERRWRVFDRLALEASQELVPLRRAIDFLTDGPFGSAFSSSDYVDNGLGVIRLGNIGFAKFRGDDLVYLPMDRASEFSRFQIKPGDVLVAALGDDRNHAGRACVAPDLGPAIVKGKCFCARLDPRVARGDFVALACSSPAAAERFRERATGSTRKMINLDIFRSLTIPLPTIDDQRRVVVETEAAWERLDRLARALTRQIELLAERRQALITAAVTGEFAVPGAL